MRSTLYWIILCCICSGCSASRHSGSGNGNPSLSSREPSLQNPALHGTGASPRERVVGLPLKSPPGYAYVNAKGQNIEELEGVAFKYAMQLDVPVEVVTDIPLYHFIDNWVGTPYHLGGNTQDGVDCSGFTKVLEQTIFNLNIPRTSAEQFKECHKVPVQEMQEGDLVFFGTRKGVSHVGVYLANNKFVHASTSFGVMISDLGEEYWRRRFRGAGRMPQ